MAAQMGVTLFTVMIANGQSLSPQADLGAFVLTGIHMPAAWDAAALTFQVSPDGGATWNNAVAASGTEVTVAGAAQQFIPLDPATWRGVQSLKIRSGPSAGAVAQTAARTITLVGRLI